MKDSISPLQPMNKEHLSQMRSYDVFNGDADGICALHQLRLAHPRPEATLVTGVKRDIALLARLVAADVRESEITVFDISLDVNRDALLTLLARGNKITYFDHHFAGEIPADDNLNAIVDPAPEVCTGLLVDSFLNGRYRTWALVAAFGDNLHASAEKDGASLDLGQSALSILRELGELLNYNGYGRSMADLHLTPDDLFQALMPYEDPFLFFAESPVLATLRDGFALDMDLARQQVPVVDNNGGRIFQMPDQPWSRRVAGVFSNEKARESSRRAHALLVDNGDDTFMVSVRAPLSNREGAVELCRRFPTGGGRAAAAGVNALPKTMLADFVDAFAFAWPGP